MMEILENQLRDQNPPETRQTLERLRKDGYSEEKAKELILTVLSYEIFDLMKQEGVFDSNRYAVLLSKLPELPLD